MQTRGEMKNLRKKRLSPPQILALGLLALIFVGTLLLKLPIATEKPINWVEALFTTVSAATVTGLWVVDTETTFTRFGEVILLFLIQVGGLGIMTFAVLIFLMLGKKIGVRQRLLIQDALNQTSFGGLVLLAKNVLYFALAIQAITFLLLSVRWIPAMGWGKGAYYSLFHAITAFNNAGFALWSDSLTRFAADPVINVSITFAIISGGIGFTVLVNLRYARSFRDLSLHTKLMLSGTMIVNGLAFLLFLMLEYDNPQTLGQLSFSGKIWAAYFQAITPRTAGFNTVSIGELRDATLFLLMVLMFIGAGSTSTGGGIKLSTFIALFLSIATVLKGKQESVLFKRTIDDYLLLKAFAVTTVAFGVVLTATFFITIIETEPFIQIAFEVFSAFGTVGLSTGITGHLSSASLFILMIVMFIGKIGPLTLVFSLAKPEFKKIRYPKGKLFIG